MLHEMCHVAAWLVDDTSKPPHGPVFQKWVRTVLNGVPEANITTCHSYRVHKPYKFRCTAPDCLQIYGRHSKKGVNIIR